MVVQVDANGKATARRPGFLRRALTSAGDIHTQITAEMDARYHAGQIVFGNMTGLDQMLVELVVKHIDERTVVVPEATAMVVQNYADRGPAETDKCFQVASFLLQHDKMTAAQEVYRGIRQSTAAPVARAVAGANGEGVAAAMEKRRYRPLHATDIWHDLVEHDPALVDSRLDRKLVENALFAEPKQKKKNVLIKVGKAAYGIMTVDVRDHFSTPLGAYWPADDPVSVAASTSFARGSMVLGSAQTMFDLTTALDHYQIALATDGGLSGYLMNVGTHYHNTGRQDSSGTAFYAALRAHKEGPKYTQHLADIAHLNPWMATITDALIHEQYKKATDVAKALRDKKYLQSCMDACSLILAVNNHYPHALYFAGTAAEMDGRLDLALDYAKILHTVAPEHTTGKQLLDRVMQKLGIEER